MQFYVPGLAMLYSECAIGPLVTPCLSCLCVQERKFVRFPSMDVVRSTQVSLQLFLDNLGSILEGSFPPLEPMPCTRLRIRFLLEPLSYTQRCAGVLVLCELIRSIFSVVATGNPNMLSDARFCKRSSAPGTENFKEGLS